MHTLLRCGKNNKHTHTHDYWFVSGFQQKKTGKQEKKRKTMMCRRRYCLLLLLERTSERTGRVQQRREKLGRLVAATERKKSACIWQQ
jgi:hypothetical protein